MSKTLARGENTRVLNHLNRLLLKYTRKKDWPMVYLLIATIGSLMERGEL
jgi:hypothetical protein